MNGEEPTTGFCERVIDDGGYCQMREGHAGPCTREAPRDLNASPTLRDVFIYMTEHADCSLVLPQLRSWPPAEEAAGR